MKLMLLLQNYRFDLPEKWTFEDGTHLTGKVNEVVWLIYQIISNLRRKKTGLNSKIRTQSGLVPAGEQKSNHLEQDLKLLERLIA